MRAGQIIQLAVTADHIHWFDPETGDAITGDSSVSAIAAPPSDLSGLVFASGAEQ